MFEQLKQILMIDYQNELSRFDHLKQNIDKLEKTMMNDKSEEDYQLKIASLNKKYGALKKNSKEYKNELTNIQIEYNDKLKKFEELYNHCIDLKNEAASINIYVIQKKKEQLMNATSLEDLKMTEEEASQLISEKQNVAPIIYDDNEIDEYIADYVASQEFLNEIGEEDSIVEEISNDLENKEGNIYQENFVDESSSVENQKYSEDVIEEINAPESNDNLSNDFLIDESDLSDIKEDKKEVNGEEVINSETSINDEENILEEKKKQENPKKKKSNKLIIVLAIILILVIIVAFALNYLPLFEV